MYGKIFEQIFSSSIMEEELETRYVFMSMLAMCEPGGIVDITHEALSRKINLDIGKVKKAIEALRKPDPRSRTQDDDGRRLALIDEHRDWGWIVVNRDKYTKIQSNEDRRAYMREYMRKRREDELLTSCKTNEVNKEGPVNTCKHPVSTLKEEEEEGEEEAKAEAKAEANKEVAPTTSKKLTDEQFIKALKTNPAYSHIRLEDELAKMDAWLLTHPGRQKTRRFVVNWLNKIEKPMEVKNRTTQRPVRKNPTLDALDEWRERNRGDADPPKSDEAKIREGH